VIEDAGDTIRLQHILVAGRGEEKVAVKHWRQDWIYEPEEVLVFVGGNAWAWRPIDEAAAEGKWAQTVYQVDDSPRYGALAAWSHDRGVSEWEPPSEWRPLPRRDATTRDDYHVIDGVNRHAITPFGWVHEQDNSKVVLTDGGPRLLVRDEWSRIAAASDTFGLTIPGEPEPLYEPLLELADRLAEGEIGTEGAIRRARQIIAGFTTTEVGSLEERIDEAPRPGARPSRHP